jgi:hypothetical protein
VCRASSFAHISGSGEVGGPEETECSEGPPAVGRPPNWAFVRSSPSSFTGRT